MRILIVDDEVNICMSLTRILEDENYQCESAYDAKTALNKLESFEPRLVLLDVRLDGANGLDVLKTIKEKSPDTIVIMISGHSGIIEAVKAIKLGAFDFLEKPLGIHKIKITIKNAIKMHNISSDYQRLKTDFDSRYQMIGNSKPIQDLRKMISRIAPTDSKVLIRGESGTGKELIAYAIHNQSKRANNAFIKFNSAAIPTELVESELFGHEKGAFTGAIKTKSGKMELADEGTLFLDEIGDMPISMQVKLLRAIQEREILRVGGTEPIKVDVRFIAATHRDLHLEVENGNFRQDLYYRLNVVSLKIPPLVERKEDIPLLANYFLKKKSIEMEKDVKFISREAMDVLLNYSWPGNVRELENVIERAVALANKAEITPDLLPEYLQIYEIHTFRRDSSNMPTLEQVEKDYILWVLEKCGGNRSKAAKILGIDRVSLWRKLKKWI